MPIIEPSTIVAWLAVAFGVTFIFMIVSAVKQAKKNQVEWENIQAEIKKRAAANGYRFSDNNVKYNELDWTMQGTGKAGHAWTLEYRTSLKLRGKHGVWNKLEWRCPGITTEREMFLFESRRLIRIGLGRFAGSAVKNTAQGITTNIGDKNEAETAEQEIELMLKRPEVELGETLKKRWKLVTQDESLTRKVFSVRVRDLLMLIPPPIYSNSQADINTRIEYGRKGLMVTLGVDKLEADTVDFVIGLSNTLLNEIIKIDGSKHVYS